MTVPARRNSTWPSATVSRSGWLRMRSASSTMGSCRAAWPRGSGSSWRLASRVGADAAAAGGADGFWARAAPAPASRPAATASGEKRIGNKGVCGAVGAGRVRRIHYP